MFFDRYEIHIQAFVDFINATAIIFKSSSSQNINQHEVLKNKKQKTKTNGTYDFHKISTKIKKSPIFTKIICFQDVPIFFLYFVKHFGNR